MNVCLKGLVLFELERDWKHWMMCFGRAYTCQAEFSEAQFHLKCGVKSVMSITMDTKGFFLLIFK